MFGSWNLFGGLAKERVGWAMASRVRKSRNADDTSHGWRKHDRYRGRSRRILPKPTIMRPSNKWLMLVGARCSRAPTSAATINSPAAVVVEPMVAPQPRTARIAKRHATSAGNSWCWWLLLSLLLLSASVPLCACAAAASKTYYAGERADENM